MNDNLALNHISEYNPENCNMIGEILLQCSLEANAYKGSLIGQKDSLLGYIYQIDK